MATNSLKFSTNLEGIQKSIVAFRKLGEALTRFRKQWLFTLGGEWPDRFVLLNRYLRTGMEPEYFSDERWSA